MRTTIKDIARECGVSVSAVSLALSDKPNRISKATRQKVMEAAARLNYQPNPAALSLVNRRSKTIGIVLGDMRNTHISSLFMAINKKIEGKGYSMVCHILDDQADSSDSEVLDLIASENVAGLVWAKPLQWGRETEQRNLRNRIDRLEVPVIAMDPCHLSCPGMDVCFDYESGAYLATRHLLEYGHRRIGALAGREDYQVTHERIAGYRRALAEYEIPFEETLVHYGDYTMESGYKAMSYLMGQNVTAVFSFNDEMAFGLYRAARIYGIRIPKDLSIIGFDDVPFDDVMEIPLSTVRIPIVEMGEFIGEKMLEFLEDPELTARSQVIYKPDLLLRASTARMNGQGGKN